jgi:perosamine synthetase
MNKIKSRNIVVSEHPHLHFSNIFRARMQSGLFQSFYGKDVTNFYLGRGALGHAIKLLNLAKTDKVLVPSYHCGVDIESILTGGVGIVYYKVKEDLTADMNDLSHKIDINSRAVVTTHYYGFPQPIEQIKRFCLEKNLFLIEDCAHALFTSYQGRPLGTFGDVSIFSQRKSLPLPDGGALLINNPNIIPPSLTKKPSQIVSLKRTIGLLIGSLRDTSNNKVLLISSKIIKKTINNLFRIKFGKTYNMGMEYDISMTHIMMSNISKKIMDGTQIENVVQKRRANFKYLLEHFSNSLYVKKVYSSLPEGTCPLFFPVRITGKVRQEVQDLLRRDGIHTFVFGKNLHDSLPNNTFTEAEKLSREILCLPIHQDLSRDDLDYMLSRVISI